MIDFPSSPSDGQVFTSAGVSWVYSTATTAWRLQATTVAGPTGPTGPTGNSGAQLSINAQTGTTYTLQLSDAGQFITLSNGSAITVTVPLNSVVAFPIGTQINMMQLGAGRVTVSPVSGSVTINSSLGLKTRTQYSIITLVQTATNVWVLTGDSSVA